MKKYIHNPNIYRYHFQHGSALPGFSGIRMHRQRGDGIGAFLGKLARKAIPLLISGAKMAKPHVVKAAKNIAEDVGKNMLSTITQPKRKANERMTTPHKRRKIPRKYVRRQQHTKRTTPPDVFDKKHVTYS